MKVYLPYSLKTLFIRVGRKETISTSLLPFLKNTETLKPGRSYLNCYTVHCWPEILSCGFSVFSLFLSIFPLDAVKIQRELCEIFSLLCLLHPDIDSSGKGSRVCFLFMSLFLYSLTNIRIRVVIFQEHWVLSFLHNYLFSLSATFHL